MLQRRLFLLLLVLLHAGMACVHAAELGSFPARTWGLRQIRLGDNYPDPPFSSIAQSRDGLIYAGDATGLLEFDGRNWRRIPLPTESPVLVLGVTRAGALVAGGGEFLHVIPDPNTPDHVIEVAAALPAGLQGSGDFWEFAEDDAQWCVRSPALLVCQGNKGFTTFPAAHGYGRMFQTRSRILIEVDRAGLSQVTPQGPQLIVGGDVLDDDFGISSLVEFPDGSLAAITKRFRGIWRWGPGDVPQMRASIEADQLMMPVGIGVIVAPDRIALPEDNGGVAIVNLDGHVTDRIDPAHLGAGSGAQALLVDREGALWVAWRSAISRIEYPSRMRVFPLPPNMYGQSLRVTRTTLGITAFHGNRVLVLRHDAASKRWAFQQHGPTLPSIIMVDSLNGDDFAGTIEGLWSLQDGSNAIQGDLVFSSAPVFGNSSDIWVGRRNGVSHLKKMHEGWSETERSARVSFDVTSILQADPQTLWLGSRVGRLARIRMNEDGVLAGSTIEEFDQSSGLPKTAVMPEAIGTEVLFWTLGGSFHEYRDGSFQLSDTVPTEESGAIGEVKRVDDSHLLVSSPSSQLRLLKRDITGVYRYQPSIFDEIAGIEKTRSIHVDPDGVVWLANDSGLVRVDPRMEAPKPRPQQVLIRDISVGDVSLFDGSNTLPNLQLNEGASLRFGYTLPSFRAPEMNRYRSRIRNVAGQSQWSPWSNETRRDFTNLPPGELLFEVEAQDAAGVSASSASVPITVIAPWYRRTWALTLFAVVAMLAAWFGVQWRVRALRTRGAELERLVAIKTEALQMAASTDPLTGLWNRHRFGQWLRTSLTEINVKATLARADEAADLIVCVIDLDHFKRVNDLHGHAAGDLVLKAVAERLQAFKRPDDLIFRFGGEEFVYLGAQRHRNDGRQLAELIVREIGQIRIELVGGVLVEPTASVGWSAYPFYRERADLFGLDFVLGIADRALYLAKQDGRNRASGYLPNIPVDEIDRTQADWRTQAFNRHPDFLKQV
jgi:diguanylate cyclase (GGDEF)-like protein